MKIAVSGKGGVGKTTVAACLARLFAAKGYNVYAVDADPDSSLGLALGISADMLAGIKPIIDMREYIDDKAGDGALYLLNPNVGDIADKFSVEAPAPWQNPSAAAERGLGAVRFLRMGGVKSGGSSCYCRENSFLKALVNSLLLDVKDVVILDMSAGIEHLTRGTARGVDLMLIVSEPSRSSVETARNVKRLSEDLGIETIRFVGNKAHNEKDELFLRANFPRDELLGCAHFSESIAERAMGFSSDESECADGGDGSDGADNGAEAAIARAAAVRGEAELTAILERILGDWH